jgi:uncharacterized tellurite resistance protein B-like protein
MINRLKALFESGASQASHRRTDEVQLAAAALLVEAARLDGHISPDEQKVIIRILKAGFRLDSEEADYLLSQAIATAGESNQLYGFTRTLKDRLDAEERIQIIEMLWEVAYADGVLHDFEASLMRRVCGLLYVNDRDGGLARQRVLQRLGLAAGPS